MKNILSQKILVGGLAVAVVIGSVVLYGQSSPDLEISENLDAVTERAVTIANNEPSPVSVAQDATATDTATATEVEAAPKVTPKPVMEAKTTPAPVATTPVSATPTTPAPQTEPTSQSSITKTEVAIHNDAQSCWSIINGGVYDLTSYVPRHPGGKSEILAICGKDGTRLFEGQHGGDSKPERILAGFFMADLAL